MVEQAKLRSILVDDEELARENLEMLLNEHCPEIEILGKAGNITEAKSLIDAQSPEVVFLDIRMPSGAEGFELLESLPDKKFLVVFVTAFKDYAIKAFKANAIHYVLKPVDIDDLKMAVEKLKMAHQIFEVDPSNYNVYIKTLENLSKSLNTPAANQKITINHSRGFKIVEDDEISHLEADGNCTRLFFINKEKYLDTRTLKVYEDILDESKFFRTHKSHIVNLNYLKEYLNEDGYFAVLKDGSRVPIARNRLSGFMQQIKGA